MYRNKIYQINDISQQENKDLQNNSEHEQCSNKIKDDAYALFTRWIFAKRLFNKFLYLSRKQGGEITISLKALARMCGCSEKTVQRWVEKFIKLGLLERWYNCQPWAKEFKANTYRLDDIVHTSQFKYLFKFISYTPVILPIILLLSAPAAAFGQKKTVCRTSVQLEYNVDLLKSTNNYVINNKSNTREEIMKPKKDPVKTRVDLLADKSLVAKDFYPHLSDIGRYVAVLLGISPARSAHITFIPDEVLKKALRKYQFSTNKVPAKSKAKLFFSILKKLDVVIDYAWVHSIIGFYELNPYWDTLSYQEQSLLMANVSHIGRKLEQEAKEEYKLTHKDQEEEPSKAFLLEKQKAAELLAKRRKNPHSCFYVWEPPVSTNVSTGLLSDATASQTPPAPPAPSALDELGSDRMMQIYEEALLKARQQKVVEAPKVEVIEIQPEFEEPAKVKNFKVYVVEKLPQFVNVLKQANMFALERVKKQIVGQIDSLSAHDRLKLKKEWSEYSQLKEYDIE